MRLAIFSAAPSSKPSALSGRKPSGHLQRRGLLTKANEREDLHTGEFKLRHHVDLKTGMYRGRQVTEPKGDF